MESTLQTSDSMMTPTLTTTFEGNGTSPTTLYDPFSLLTIDHDPSSAVAVIEGITMIIIFLGALFANLMAMTTILTDKLLRRNLHNLLILNLIFMDLGVTITSMTFSIWSIYDNGYFLVNNYIACAFNGFGATLFTFGNFTSILAISVDRYITVCWSTRFPPSKYRAIALVVFCWALPIINVIPPSFEFLSDFKFHPDTHHCSPSWDACLYFIIWFTFIFGITVPIMVFCYVNVIWVIRRQELQMRSHSSKADAGISFTMTSTDTTRVNIPMDGVSNSTDNYVTDGPSEELNDEPSDGKKTCPPITVSGIVAETADASVCPSKQSGAKMAKTIEKRKKKKLLARLDRLSADKMVAVTGILLVLTTLMCWSPYFIIHSCFIPINPPHWLGVVSMWLGYTNSLLDPLVYSFMNRRVRARYRSLIGCRIDFTVFRQWLVRSCGRDA